MLRRDPEAILVAHMLDPNRRELYVEGRVDRLFLGWVVGEGMHPDVLIFDMDAVELDVRDGGNRGRLIRLAELALDRVKSIRCLADADWDRILGRDVPSNVWLTDDRDMEGYLLREDCLNKVLRVGLGLENVDAGVFRRRIVEVGRLAAALRLTSMEQELALPFQRTEVGSYVDCTSVDSITVRWRAFIQALLQNAGIRLSRLDDLETAWRLKVDELAGVEDRQLVHGKDVVSVLREVFLRLCGVSRDDCPRMLWLSFERDMVRDYPTLRAVEAFLTTGVV